MISNMPVLSVSEISQNLKNMVENQFAYVHVRGELTEVKQAASGHIYATLKDKDAVLNLIIWRTSAQRLSIQPQDGLEVIATGKLTTYPGRSNYQLVADKLEVAGEGALLKIIEDRRKKLASEGLFDESRKRPLPQFPTRIAVITSPTGAVIRDIMHRIAERYPCMIDLWPVLVQGEGAAAQITAALEAIAGAPDKPDLVIVARGGGSLEDLMAFNEESVVRAAANCPAPLISAVGHETDTTLIDWASDRRAPTPTAAAEMATPHRVAIIETLRDMQKIMVRSLERGAETSAQKLDQIIFRLGGAIKQIIERKSAVLNAMRPRSPQQILDAQMHKTSMLNDRLIRTIFVSLQNKEQHLTALGRILTTMSFETTLERGFVLVRDESGLPITRATNLVSGQKITLQFASQNTKSAQIS